MSEPDFSLFSSLRYDPLLLTSPENTATSTDVPTPSTSPCPFYLLIYHRDRILRAAHHFGWSNTITASLNLQNFRRACETVVGNREEPLKLRTLLSPAGTLTIEAVPVPRTTLRTLLPSSLPAPSDRSEDPTWRVHLDTIPTTSSPYTSHKTTSRDHYLAARARVGIESFAAKEEVVLWNHDGECMEGSLTSVYFWRPLDPVPGGLERDEGRWITPALSSGGNNGTTRRWLLEKGIVSEGVVEVDSIKGGETVLLSNGVRGVWAGVVVPKDLSEKPASTLVGTIYGM